MNTAERRALLGQAAVSRARELATAAPRLDPGSELYAALALLLRRPEPRKATG